MSTRTVYPTRMVEDAIEAILVYYSATEDPISEADLVDRSRDAYTIKVRSVVMWFLKTEGHLSYPAIGRRFDRDHTSVLALVRKVHDVVGVDDLQDVVAYTRDRVAKRMQERQNALLEAM